MLPYSKQNIDEDDIKAVTDVLRSDYLTQGPVVTQLEKAVSGYCQTKYAVAVNSATSALHIACLALGVSKNDKVWTTPLSFVASSNCALYCGATIDFVDVELNTGNMDMAKLAEKLTLAKQENRLPKVIIPVHLCGLSCDMVALNKLAQTYHFKIIEDASHALGGTYDNSPIGGCSYSDITVFSFHAVKNITSGEGGMALTNSKELAQQMRLLSNHGITKDSSEFVNYPQGQWYYEQQTLGFNYRMSDIHAALGLSQLSKLDSFISSQKSAVSYYKKQLGGVCQWLGNQQILKRKAQVITFLSFKFQHKLENTYLTN